MDDKTLQEQIAKRVREQIAISNLREERSRMKKRNRSIQYSVLSLCAVCILCGTWFIQDILPIQQPQPSMQEQGEKGIFIPKLEITIPSATEEMCMAYAYMYYNGNFYTAAQRVPLDATNNLKGECVGDMQNMMQAYQMSDYYKNATSTGLPYLKEFMEEQAKKHPETILGDREGKVYAINGYSTEFRLGYVEEDTNTIQVYERLNDITLEYGKDLYQDRLHVLDKMKTVEYQYHQDWDKGKEHFQSFQQVTEEEITQFIQEMYEAKFVDATDKDVYNTQKKQAHLYVRMTDGTTVTLRLLEDGYVHYDGWSSRVFLQLDSALFKKIFEEATPDNYVYASGK